MAKYHNKPLMILQANYEKMTKSLYMPYSQMFEIIGTQITI
ncbi:hypothetical protein F383_21464 [Gossypium arboreum]|uniref:Uncharacterized protein n=1 Tax=Gossypium arboreum TaxID=29729 RepID=A0A0B0P012_GOSAR|nr:hypothetical protein F383_21464 [Gossypium arboreum]